MKNLSCEDFEREFAEFSRGGLSADRRDTLERHRRECPLCQRITEETWALRSTLQSLPQLEAPPYFLANIKREINRLEHGLKKPRWNPSPLPRFLTAGAGFAIAVLLSFIFLQSGERSTGFTPPSSPTASTEQIQPNQNLNVPEEEVLKEDPSEQWYASEEGVIDTATHRLPEPAGQDSIPIPVENDYWKLNQVSTTPDDR